MALSDNTNMYMPVAPAYGYGNNGGGFFGGDWAWIILLLLIGGNGWGLGGFGMGGMMPWMMGAGMGGFGLDYLYPWLNNSQHISDGFRDQQLQGSINSLQNSVTSGFGDVQNALCSGFAGVNAGIANAAAQAEIAANGRQMANMQQMFAMQTQAADCCCKTQTNIADLKYTVAQENCADRQAVNDGIRDVITALTAGVQSIKDQLCQDKIDAKNDTISQLRQELLYARLHKSANFITALLDAVDPYTLTNMSRGFLLNTANKIGQYEILPVDQLAGEHILGQRGFNEFHPDADALVSYVISTFCEPLPY